MKKLISLFLVFSIICFYGNLYAKERHGADLAIQKTDGQQIKGELIAVKEDSLLLKEHDSGADVTSAVREIKTITIVKKSKRGKGALYGFGIGAAGGALAGGLLVEPSEYEKCVNNECFTEKESRVNNAIFGLIFLGAVGALTGLIVGGFIGKDKTIQIEGKSEAAIKEVLEELRKNARVPDFQ
jgi:hypothetical protein